MTITRLAPARGSKHAARTAAAGAALAAVTVAGVAERTALAASFTVLGHLHWALDPGGRDHRRPDRSASDDVNSSWFLSVLVGRSRSAAAASYAAGRREGTGGKYPS